MTSNFQGSIQGQEPASGDGDGDGDCVPVERLLITAFDFESLADGYSDAPGDAPWPIPIAIPQPIPFDTLTNMGHTSWTAPAPAEIIEISDAPTFNTDFEATLVISMQFTVLGAVLPDVLVTIEADYGFGWSALRKALYAFDVFPNDQLITSSLLTLVPAADTGAGEVTPQVRAMAVIETGDGVVEVTNRQFFVKQCFPVLTQTDVDNCEVPIEVCPLPIDVRVTDNFGATTGLPVGSNTPPPTAGYVIAPVAGVANWIAVVAMDAFFDPADYTATAVLDGVDIADGLAPVFTTITSSPAGPAASAWQMDFTTPPILGYLQIRVTKNSDPNCTWLQNIAITLAA